MLNHPKIVRRCSWCGTDPLMIAYHDKEWGVANHNEQIFFEFLILESAQAGLSWAGILKRREAYRKAFSNFEVHKVAQYSEEDIKRLMEDSGIIRNRMKIDSAINTAKQFIAVQKEFGSFEQYLYSFMPGNKPLNNRSDKIPVTTTISDAISKDMKRRGFRFFGSITCYAYMQATGMVNDHQTDCSFK